jgi:hypothetical protein
VALDDLAGAQQLEGAGPGRQAVVLTPGRVVGDDLGVDGQFDPSVLSGARTYRCSLLIDASS